MVEELWLGCSGKVVVVAVVDCGGYLWLVYSVMAVVVRGGGEGGLWCDGTILK